MGETEDSEDQSVFSPKRPPEKDFSDVVGLEEEIQEIEERLLVSAKGDIPDGFRTVSLLMYGKKGVGKREFLEAIAGELKEYGYTNYQSVESLEKHDRHGTEIVREVFHGAVEEEPMTLVLDFFDEYVRADSIRVIRNEVEKIRRQGKDVVVLSVMPERVLGDPDARGYIQTVDISLELEKPSIDRREKLLTKRFRSASEDVGGIDSDVYSYERLARETDSFGVDDLESVVRRSAMIAHERDEMLTEEGIAEVIESVDKERLERIVDEKTLMGVDVPEITFDDIGGYGDVKDGLRERVQQALTRNDLAKELKLDFGGGILLHGPPGTGKTMLVRALANELDHTFIPINSAKLRGNAMQGPAEMVSGFFYRAQRNSPAILFFDEFDAVGVRRGDPRGDEEAVNAMLSELDGIEQMDETVVIAATNRPEILDPALLRPGRLDYHFEIDIPDEGTQASIFDKQTSEIDTEDDITGEWFSEITEDLTGAEIASVCERAVAISVRGMEDVNKSDVTLARESLERAYNEFLEGRLDRDSLETSPAFR
jgi:transitional endoplasmic reticulum ATPase